MTKEMTTQVSSLMQDVCVFEDTSAMTKEQWLCQRKKGIGGSDAGAIMGLNKYATPLTCYMDKVGKKKNKSTLATDWGNILEEPIRQKTAAELGVLAITKPGGTFVSKEYDFMRANLDGILETDKPVKIGNDIVEGVGGWECKTTKRGEGFSDTEVPDTYYAQVQHYMKVTGLKWFVLTVFFTSDYSHRHYIIRRNEGFITGLVEQEIDFWNDFVLKNIPPAPCGNEYENEVIDDLASNKAGDITLDEDCLRIIDKERGLDAQIKEMQRTQTQLKEQIKMHILGKVLPCQMTQTIKAKCGSYKVNWLYMQSKRVDTDALKKAGLYDKYSKVSECRQLRISGSAKASEAKDDIF